MTRTMFDSVTAADLPAGGDLYAAYINGRYRNIDAVRARFPRARIVTIATRPLFDADVLDVERHDATPAQAPPWVVRQRARGADPTVYCIVSAWAAVRDAFHAAGVPQPHYWIAHYDNKAVLPIGAVAKQYGGNVAEHYDISIVADFWPGIDEEDDMYSDADRARDDKIAKQVQEIHDSIYKGHPEFAQPGIEGSLAAVKLKLGA